MGIPSGGSGMMLVPALSDGSVGRHASLRADPAAIEALATGGRAAILPLWRGKPLLAAPGKCVLAGWLPWGHAALEGMGPPVFLGFKGEAPCFCCDLPIWRPEADEAAVAAPFFDPTEQHHPACPDGWCFAELRGAMAGLDPQDANLAATARALLGWHETHGFCAACGARTVMAQAGWQRDCPSCGRSHFPRTDPVVIMLVTNGNRVLLGRSAGWPEGMYSLLAGFMEPGETIETAVRREVAEETGVRTGAVRYLASQPWPWPSSLMIGCTAEAESADITLDPRELEDALWLSREELVDVVAGTHSRLRAPREGAIAGVLLRRWLADAGV